MILSFPNILVEMVNVEIGRVTSILLIRISLLDHPTQDQKMFNWEWEISRVANKFVTRIQIVKLSISTYLTQDTTIIAGSGKNLVILQMVQNKAYCYVKNSDYVKPDFVEQDPFNELWDVHDMDMGSEHFHSHEDGHDHYHNFDGHHEHTDEDDEFW